MSAERQKGLTLSAILHLLWLILIVFGLPSLFSRQRIEEPAAITVELLPITGITNVKPSEQKPEDSKQDEKASPKSAPPVKTAEPAPTPLNAPAPKPKDKKAEEKPDPKKDEKKKKTKEEDLEAVLRAVRDTAQKQNKKSDSEKKDDGDKKKAISNQYDPTLPMSLSEKDAVRSQIQKCWSVPAGAKDAQDLVIVLKLEMQLDGTVQKVELGSESKGRYNSDTFFRAAADSAIRAVRQCSPLKNLPQDKYGTWKEMELLFDPKDMLL